MSNKPGINLTEGKIASFVVGTQKKTRFQKEKEARDAKKKEAEQEAASVYEKFVASFDADESR